MGSGKGQTMTTRRTHAQLTEADERVLLAAATAAPSLHNSQPWLFEIEDGQVRVYANPSRHLTRSDPTGRSLLISCGAALFNLRVAAEHLGFHPRVHVLPDAGHSLQPIRFPASCSKLVSPLPRRTKKQRCRNTRCGNTGIPTKLRSPDARRAS